MAISAYRHSAGRSIMLLRNAILTKIAAGRVTMALRRWQRPSVKAGGRLRTGIGELAIDAVEAITFDDISESDARHAGFASRADAIAELKAHRDGTVYRIRLRLAGPDTRVALRERSATSATEQDALRERLARLDARSAQGPWTMHVLRLIDSNESIPAGELAKMGGFEKEWLKLNVRKLKNLGLTESLHPGGYRLSPRGRAWLAHAGSTG